MQRHATPRHMCVYASATRLRGAQQCEKWTTTSVEGIDRVAVLVLLLAPRAAHCKTRVLKSEGPWRENASGGNVSINSTEFSPRTSASASPFESLFLLSERNLRARQVRFYPPLGALRVASRPQQRCEKLE